MSEEWLVVQSQVHSELRAVANLQRQGFITYMPFCLKRRRHARRIETVKVPLFPRYAFVSSESAVARWSTIRSTFGVSSLVMFGRNPAVLSSKVLEGLKLREEGGVVRLPRRTFHQGEKIRITDGTFAGCFGLFEEMQDEERLCVLIDLLGRKVRVTIDDLSVSRL